MECLPIHHIGRRARLTLHLRSDRPERDDAAGPGDRNGQARMPADPSRRDGGCAAGSTPAQAGMQAGRMVREERAAIAWANMRQLSRFGMSRFFRLTGTMAMGGSSRG
jgi:hypothetical protein